MPTNFTCLVLQVFMSTQLTPAAFNTSAFVFLSVHNIIHIFFKNEIGTHVKFQIQPMRFETSHGRHSYGSKLHFLLQVLFSQILKGYSRSSCMHQLSVALCQSASSEGVASMEPLSVSTAPHYVSLADSMFH